MRRIDNPADFEFDLPGGLVLHVSNEDAAKWLENLERNDARYRCLRLRISADDIADGPEPFCHDEIHVDATVDRLLP